VSTPAVLTPVETRLVAALADNPSASQADLAGKLHVTERHVRRLLARDSVRGALDEAARDGIRETASVIGRGAVRAAKALLAMAEGTSPPNSARVAACRAVLDALVPLTEFATMEGRIAALERSWAMARETTPGARPS
jgi:hypothetical protein